MLGRSMVRRPAGVALLPLLACLAGALLVPAAGATSAVAVQLKSSVGPVLGPGSCASGSGGTVVASGRVKGAVTRPLGLTLTVYGSHGNDLDLAGSRRSATLRSGASGWQVTAHVNPGFPPTRCVVAVELAETLESVYVGVTTMVPTLKAGDRAVVNRSAYLSAGPRPGDLVAFQVPAADQCSAHATTAVLRVVGLPGQTVGASNGAVEVNGTALVETWLPRTRQGKTPSFGPVPVPAARYFVLADRPAGACDSRTWGPLPATAVLGQVVKVIKGTPPTSVTKHPHAVNNPTFTT